MHWRRPLHCPTLGCPVPSEVGRGFDEEIPRVRMKETPLVRRIVTLALSLSFVLGLSAIRFVSAQDEAKKDAPPAEAPKADVAPAPAAAPAPAPAPAPAASAAAPAEKPIPPEVQAKIDAARKAVAEAIAAAEKAGLVETTIDPPPILDILLTGQAHDLTVLKAKADELKAKTAKVPDVGVSPEVFGAWHTGFGKLEGISAMDDVRIIPPSKGLTDWYRKKADVFKPLLEEARKALAATPAPRRPPPKSSPKNPRKRR